MEETFEELKAIMNAYPHELNKHIHHDARNKLIKMGRLDEIRGVKKKLQSVKESVSTLPIEQTDRFKLLKDKTVVELKSIAKKKGLTGYSSLKEDDLIKAILK